MTAAARTSRRALTRRPTTLVVATLGVAFATRLVAAQQRGPAPPADIPVLEQACDKGDATKCWTLGSRYATGRGVAKDDARAAALYQRACDLGNIGGGCGNLGAMYELGRGVPRDLGRAASLFERACESSSTANGWCMRIANMYERGAGVAKNATRAQELFKRACDGGSTPACNHLNTVYGSGAPAQNPASSGPAPAQQTPPAAARPAVSSSSGTAFVVDDAGLLLTAYHVVDGATSIAVKCPGLDSQPVVISTRSPTVDLAVLQAKGSARFKEHLNLVSTPVGAIGDRVFTVGYPAPTLLGVEPKYSEGTISSIAGPRGDASFFQVSVPIQPGNSGGALMDESGNVLGIVVSAAAPAAFARDTGTLPQNINWAVKAPYAAPLMPGVKPTAPKRLSAKERSAVIARATAASCLVVATRPAPAATAAATDATTTTAPKPIGRPSTSTPPRPAGGATAGVVGGVAGGIVGGLPAPPPPPPPPPPSAPVRVGGSVRTPTKIRDVKPIYPAIAQSARVQGVVILETTIGPKGDVQDAKVVRSIPLLDAAALDAVKQWQFTPTLMNGVAVPVIMTVTVNFSLLDDPAAAEKACTAGDLAKCGRLAGMLRTGNGAGKDPARASTLYARACDGGVASACQNLARMYEFGEGIPVDLPQAVKFNRQACDAGDVAACTSLARMTHTGRGVTKNVAQATSLYERAIDAGQRACGTREPRACLDLAFVGLMLQTGRDAPQNVTRALGLYRTACDNGSAVGCAFLGAAYSQGIGGVGKDGPQAATFYERGCPAAFTGAPTDDPDRTAMVYTGRVQACGALGGMYEQGAGVPQSTSQAVMFYQRACAAQTNAAGIELPRLQNRCDDVTRLQGKP